MELINFNAAVVMSKIAAFLIVGTITVLLYFSGYGYNFIAPGIVSLIVIYLSLCVVFEQVDEKISEAAQEAN